MTTYKENVKKVVKDKLATIYTAVSLNTFIFDHRFNNLFTLYIYAHKLNEICIVIVISIHFLLINTLFLKFPMM